MAWLKDNTFKWFADRIKSDMESRASFFYIPYDEIPKEYYFAEWRK